MDLFTHMCIFIFNGRIHVEMSYKVVLVGNADTGKTSLLNRYVHDEFDTNPSTTIGVEFAQKDIGAAIPMTLWDTAGQERYRSLTSSFYRGAHAIVFVFSADNEDSFYGLEQWWREYLSYGDRECVTLVVANKIDQTRTVSKERGLDWAAQKQAGYEEVSAKTGDGVQEAFDHVVRRIRGLPSVKAKMADIASKPDPTHDTCCS